MKSTTLASRLLTPLAIALLASCSSSPASHATTPVSHATRIADGAVVAVDHSTQKVRLQLVSPTIVHVTVAPDGNFNLPASLMAVRTGGDGSFSLNESGDEVVLKTSALETHVSTKDGTVRFADAQGKPILAERAGGRTFAPTTVEGKPFVAVRQRFESPDDEAFYGLGQHQNRQMNYKGEDVELAQHNMDVGIPFVVSTRNYGLLWDNNSITRFGDPREYPLAGQTLKFYDADGKEGGLTARYYAGGTLKATRVEHEVNYAYIKDLTTWPAEPTAKKTDRVVWEGSFETASSGEQKFRLYSSSYAKVTIDGKVVYDDWRQNWNPWYHNLRSADGHWHEAHDQDRVEAERRLYRPLPSRPAAGRGAARSLAVFGGRSRGRLLLRFRLESRRCRFRLSHHHRQVDHAAALGLRLLAEPRALQDAEGNRRHRDAVPQARSAARQHRRGLDLLARERMGLARVRHGALPRSQGDGRRSCTTCTCS